MRSNKRKHRKTDTVTLAEFILEPIARGITVTPSFIKEVVEHRATVFEYLKIRDAIERIEARVMQINQIDAPNRVRKNTILNRYSEELLALEQTRGAMAEIFWGQMQ